MKDWGQNDVQDDIKSIYPEEIEDKFYPKETNIKIFSPEVLEESDKKNEE